MESRCARTFVTTQELASLQITDRNLILFILLFFFSEHVSLTVGCYFKLIFVENLCPSYYYINWTKCRNNWKACLWQLFFLSYMKKEWSKKIKECSYAKLPCWLSSFLNSSILYNYSLYELRNKYYSHLNIVLYKYSLCRVCERKVHIYSDIVFN